MVPVNFAIAALLPVSQGWMLADSAGWVWPCESQQHLVKLKTFMGCFHSWSALCCSEWSKIFPFFFFQSAYILWHAYLVYILSFRDTLCLFFCLVVSLPCGWVISCEAHASCMEQQHHSCQFCLVLPLWNWHAHQEMCRISVFSIGLMSLEGWLLSSNGSPWSKHKKLPAVWLSAMQYLVLLNLISSIFFLSLPLSNFPTVSAPLFLTVSAPATQQQR